MIRILIADDHLMLRQGLKSMLDSDPEVRCVAEASNGKEVLALLEAHDIDVILMDINMPVMDGMDTTRLVVDKYPHVKVLALTMLEQGSFIKQMLRSGATGYLLKTAVKDEVIKAIHMVYQGNRYLGARATELLMDTVSRQPGPERRFDPDLTRREFEVLQLIAQGCSDTEISEKLHLSPSTIESHRKNVRHKLMARNSAEMVRIAMERGLL